MLKKSYTILVCLTLLSVQSAIHSSSALQKISRAAAQVIKKTAFSAKNMSSYNHDNNKRQQVIVRDIIDSLWDSPINSAHIEKLEQAFANHDLQRAQTVVHKCTKTCGEKHPEIIKINKLFHEYSCIEAARQI